MKFRWAAPLVVLALSAFMVPSVAAQGAGQTGAGRGPGPLGQNYPNPFNPETTIPFSIGLEGNPPTCADPAKVHRVSLRIYNLLMQVVAVPILQGGGEQRGQPVVDLRLNCGEFTAFWDGKIHGTSREVSSGVYLYRLEIDGKAFSKQMLVVK